MGGGMKVPGCPKVCCSSLFSQKDEERRSGTLHIPTPVPFSSTPNGLI